MPDPIKIDGLREFQAGLRRMDRDLPKGLRLAMNEASGIVVDAARARVPKRSGRAARSIRAQSTRTASRVTAGGRQAPYYPWLDFGGRVGPGRAVRRAFLADGRYIYPAYNRERDRFVEVLQRALVDVAASAGVGVQ